MTDVILRDDDGRGVITLTLNKPELRNPISDLDMVDALVAALAQADADPATRVVILTAAGRAFSSGGNIANMKKGQGLADELAAVTRRNYKQGIQRIPLAFDALEIPVIAAVNGPAVGAGCDLACMCDIRIAGESAKFAESFVKMGLVPGDGGAWFLPQIVGYSKAAELALTGDAIDARQALACGLVSQVVPDGELLDAARMLAARIAANPVHAVRMTKRLMRQSRGSSLADLLETSAGFQALCHATRDNEEAVAAFLEKRPPVFTGR